jgi:hypothetical protein
MNSYTDESSTQLEQISTISQILRDLYTSLEDSLTDPNSSSTNSENIINSIESITRVKDILIKNYLEMNTNAQQTSISQKIAYDETMNAISATDKEIEESKKKIALLNEEKYNRLRQIEINNYYGLQYSNHQKIILYIIFLCIFFLITIILKNKNIIPSDLFYWINIIVISISIIVITYMVRDSYNRDNMNYDEYNYGFNYNKTILEYPIKPMPVNGNMSEANSTCYVNGSKYCSENQIFNSELQKCETLPPTATEEETNNSSSDGLVIVDKSNNTQISI